MSRKGRVAFALVLFLFSVIAQDPWDDAITKAKKLVSGLSVDEKITLAAGIGWATGACVGNTGAISRVNFPGYCLEDSPTGVRFTDHASAFPAGINAAMTWDRDLIYRRAAAMGEEYRGKGVNVALGPMMNMGRVPAGGRNWEGFGGDPYLTGESAAASIKGIQSQGVMACAKHYIGNEQEHYRDKESSNIDDRTIHELYAYPFLKSVQAGVASLMCSYNQVNNTYACQNDRTLNQILKSEFGFRGFVMSDWWATKTNTDSVLGGMDMIMPGDPSFATDLKNALQSGRLTMDRVNDMAVRILTPWYLLGQDSNFPAVNFNAFHPEQSKMVNVAGDHYKVIREVGAASNVLLKNSENLLPFKKSLSFGKQYTFGLVGSDAGLTDDGPNTCPDHGCDYGTLAQGWGSGTTNFPYLISPMAAIQQRALENSQTVTWALSDWDVATAVAMAKTVDVALVFSNADSGEDYITFDGNQGDRNNLTLWNNGDVMIKAIADVNPNTVVVIHSVGPVLAPWADHPNIKAIVFAGLPGQESGNALVDVLFGDVNPSGRLIFTIAKERSDYPAEVVYSSPNPSPQIDYKEGLFIDYKWFDAKKIEPTFEFGFGLSYTTFKYSNLAFVKTGEYDGNLNTSIYNVSVTVTNSGNVAGHEVAQLYLGFPNQDEPVRQLRGFERVHLNVGESKTVKFPLDSLELSTWDVGSQEWNLSRGNFTAFVGASSRDIRLQGSFVPRP